MRTHRTSKVFFIGVLLLWLVLGSYTTFGQATILEVTAVAWSPSATQIAVGGYNYSGGNAIPFLTIQNPTNQAVILDLSSGSGSQAEQITGVSWSPDGKYIASSSTDGTIAVWNVNDSSYTVGSLLGKFGSYSYGVDDVAWSPDGKWIAALAATAKTLSVWSTVNNSFQLTSSQAVIDPGLKVNWSPNSSLLAINSTKGIVVYGVSSTGSFIAGSEFAIKSTPHSPGPAGFAWNPAGTQLAYSDPYAYAIHIYDAATKALVRDLEVFSHPFTLAWSPDGTKLAYAADGNTVRVMDVNTGAELVSYPTGKVGIAENIAWTPDSNRLAIPRAGTTPLIVSAPSSVAGTGLRGQYFNNADLTAPVFFRVNSTVDFNWAAGSPDAAAIAADTFSIRWTGKVQPLYTEAYTFYISANDGMRLWVDNQQIINSWINRTTEAEVASSPVILIAGNKYDIKLEYYENTGNAAVHLSWSSAHQAKQIIPKTQLYPPEGQLAFTGITSGNHEIYVVNPDGTGDTNISNNASADDGAVWSPDGTKVAFVSQRTGNKDIWMVNADGTGLRQLTNSTSDDYEPTWSPDSTKIAFTSDRTGAGDIYSIVVTGTGIPTATRLTTNALHEYLAMWSPNGTKIAYTMDTTTNGPDLFLIPSTGGTPVQITNRNGIDSSAYWSPDGSKIAFRGYASGIAQIFVVNATSPFTVTQLTNSTGGNNFQSWSPDSAKILFQSVRDGNNEIYVINPDGTGETRLTNTATSETYTVWSADARQIAYIRGGHIWMMNADGSNQHQFSFVSGRSETELVWWQTKQSN